MVDFRPHILQCTIKLSDDTLDPATGAVTPAVTKNIEYACRVSPNGAGREVSTMDGQRVVYGYIIHADKGVEELPFGALVKVFSNGSLIAEGKVLRFWRNQMNVRIWV